MYKVSALCAAHPVCSLPLYMYSVGVIWLWYVKLGYVSNEFPGGGCLKLVFASSIPTRSIRYIRGGFKKKILSRAFSNFLRLFFCVSGESRVYVNHLEYPASPRKYNDCLKISKSNLKRIKPLKHITLAPFLIAIRSENEARTPAAKSRPQALYRSI